MIDTSNWKEFHLYDIFDIDMGNKMDRGKMSDGTIAFVGRTANNNGINARVGKVVDHEKYGTVEPYEKGCITLALGGSIGSCFIQEEPFYTSQNVAVLISKINQSDYALRFITSVITHSVLHGKYEAFTEELNKHIKTDFVISLPATSDGQPDWDYMESYMKAVMEESEKSLENLRKADDTKHLIDVSGWGEFRVGDLLHMEKQIELNPVYAYNNSTDNETLYPFYGQSSENNGIIDYYYLGENLLNNKDAQFCIMIHSNTHLAYCVNTPFYLKDGHGATTIFTNKNLNNMTTYFLISVLNTTMNGNFDYDTKATKERLNDLIVKIPITSTGEPDWQYMEDYMRRIMDKSEQIISDLQIGA